MVEATVRQPHADTVEGADVQALALQGYGRLRAAAYVVLEITDAAAARTWLAGLLPDITVGQTRPPRRALNVALTSSGLVRLGLPATTAAGFSLEFQEGMTSRHRGRLLGDVGDAAPSQWTWGGPTGPSVDLLVLLFAADDDDLADALERHRSSAAAHGLAEIVTLPTQYIGFSEHFGFRDGLSQPSMAGSGRPAAAMHTIRPGEFLLGYRNEHGQYPRTPLVDASDDPDALLEPDPAGSTAKDFGRNGSYLVLRTLDQDVGAFWRFADQATRRPDGTTDREAATALAAHMVGRWPSGAPVTLSPMEDRPELATHNDFGYHADDPHGLRCPIGAHVRRTNPRDSLPPRPGTSDSVDVGKRHRILRRGRPYGPPIDRDAALVEQGDGQRRGLHFIALCADIARQFEFISHTWTLNPHFAGLYNDADPILGGHTENRRSFTVQDLPVRRRYTELPTFVSVRGGAYFFLPSLRALQFLARR